MEHEAVLRLLQVRVPRLAANGADLDGLAGAAIAAWTRHTADTFDTTDFIEAATRAVVDAIWPIGYRTGAQAGHLAVARSFAAAALDAAEPARPGMSDRHRNLANRLHAARVALDGLRGYLTNSGWRPTGTWRGGDIFELIMIDGAAEVLVPPAGVRDYVHRIVEAATLVADVEDRDVASVLADLAPPRRRSQLSHAALRYLWHVYDTADDVADTPSSVRPELPTATTPLRSQPAATATPPTGWWRPSTSAMDTVSTVATRMASGPRAPPSCQSLTSTPLRRPTTTGSTARHGRGGCRPPTPRPVPPAGRLLGFRPCRPGPSASCHRTSPPARTCRRSPRSTHHRPCGTNTGSSRPTCWRTADPRPPTAGRPRRHDKGAAMTLQPSEPAANPAETAVRHAIADADAPALVTISRTGGSVSADAIALAPDASDQYGLVVALHAIALGMAKYPGFFDDVCGYAIALPAYDIAYLCTIDGAATIAIGPDPRDDRRHRSELMDALNAMVDAGPGNRNANGPSGHAFSGLDRIYPIDAKPAATAASSAVDRQRHR